MSDKVLEGAVCTPNIGPVGRAMRLRLGVVTGAVALLGGTVAVVSGAAWWARCLVFVPAVMGTYGFFQAREKT